MKVVLLEKIPLLFTLTVYIPSKMENVLIWDPAIKRASELKNYLKNYILTIKKAVCKTYKPPFKIILVSTQK